MENENTELMAFRLPKDLAQMIRARAIGGATITDVVVRMLRAAPVQLNYAEHHDGARPRRRSKKAIQIETLRASDPMASERPEIDYGAHEQVPSGGSVSVVGATRPVARVFTKRPHVFHSGTRPIEGCADCAKMAEGKK